MGQGNGRGPRVSVEVMAEALVRDLAVLCPDISTEGLQAAARKTAEDNAKLTAMWSQSTADYWAIDLIRISRVMPGKADEGLRVAARRSLSQCETLDEAMRSITIFAVLTSPLVRAYCMCRGYAIRFMEGDVDPDRVEAKTEESDGPTDS